ncbi:MAG TPA: aminotransferase class I/II-fold pyridoxal phosphate-dependent enzyme, partial [Acidobacteriota bacterium]|nr:aminotransferase class I/II-fold pyridoxal phosphate-dependent enzyme [Acidobacteriota bacterium]
MKYRRMPIEIESPEQMGYGNIDCNLTESSFSDALLGDLGIDFAKLLLCYGDHLGKPELRAQIAADAAPLAAENILVTAGAASALFIISTTLLKTGERLIVMRPNYATNIETPRAIGAAIDFLDLTFDERFQLDLDRLAAKITKDTKLVSLTNPHNPTGAMMSESDLRGVIKLVESSGARLIFDETYRDMAFGEPLPCAAALSERAIS